MISRIQQESFRRAAGQRWLALAAPQLVRAPQRRALGVPARLWLTLCLALLPLLARAEVSALVKEIDFAKTGRLFQALDGDTFPDRLEAMPAWLAARKPAERVRLTGGSHWLFGELRNDSSVTGWVLDPNNTLIEHVEARIYGPDGSIQRLQTGYAYPRQYMLHYGKDIELQPGARYQVLIRFSSPYFASYPRFETVQRELYRKKVLSENILILGAFGAIAALAVFYFFVYAWVRQKSHLYYAGYLTAFFFGWLFPFQIPTELWGFQNLHWHYVPIFFLPPLCALFVIEFLRLREDAPRLAWVVGVPAAASLLLLPSCYFALNYAHILASAIVGIWMPIALAAGIIRWYRGYRPARFFVFAFSAIMVGGAVLLPPNLGLMDEIVDNAELVTLLAGTVDAMLLAFALADRINIMIIERQRYLERLNHTLQIAHTDALTGVGNRYALDQVLQREFKFSSAANDPEQQLLSLLDLDGLKQINDRFGHAEGDELLRLVAHALRNVLGPHTACFRLGGDEFAVIGRKREEAQLRAGIAQIERMIAERNFPGAGISYGIAYAHESASPSQLLTRADQRMYDHKSERKRVRAQGAAAAYPVAG
jgi:diguanylate cyclase (GGDEF)-like protein